MDRIRVPAMLIAGVTGVVLVLAIAAPAGAARAPVTSNDGAVDEVGLLDDLAEEWITTMILTPREPEVQRETDQATASTLPPTMRVLNMNLCNSGSAPCYSGAAVHLALDMGLGGADIVTLQEVCRSDVHGPLSRLMADMWLPSRVFFAFLPVLNGDATATIECTDGRGDFGNAVIGRIPVWNGEPLLAGGYYDVQDGNRRNYICAYVIDNYLSCATHLTAGSKYNALDQCNELMTEYIPTIWDNLGGRQPTVVGGDFNLQFTDWPGLPSVVQCVPPRWWGETPGIFERTHIMATDHFRFLDSKRIETDPITDHPALLVEMEPHELPPS